MLKQNDSSRHCQKTFFMSVLCNLFDIRLSLWFSITKDLMKQLRWFKQLISTRRFRGSTFLHFSDPLMTQFFSVPAPVQLTKQAEKYSPFLLGYYPIILGHWFSSDVVGWMPNLSQGTDKCAQPGKETDLPVNYKRLETLLVFVWSTYLTTRDAHNYHLGAPSFEGNLSLSCKYVLYQWYMVIPHIIKNAEN